MKNATDLIEILNRQLEPNVVEGVGSDMPLLSIAFSLKRIADALTAVASNTQFEHGIIAGEIGNVAKEVNALVRYGTQGIQTNNTHPQRY